jgi:sulfur-oxidizing protein SoxY
MRLKQETPFAPGQPNQLHLLISHPNYSGLQIDQVTRNWIPSDYVRSVKVTYAGRPVLEIDSDISISEDPSFTFDLVPQEPAELKVVVDDSSKRHFEKGFELGAGS